MKANVYKPSNSPHWYYKFQINKKTYRGSTKLTDKKAAEGYAAREIERSRGAINCEQAFTHLVDALDSKTARIAERDKLKREYAARLLAGMLGKISIEDAWAAWLRGTKQKRERTLAGYRTIWCRFTDWLGERAVTRYGFHSFRYTFVTELRENGVRLEVVQRAVGHGSPIMTMKYSKATSREREDILGVIEGGSYTTAIAA